MQETPQPFPKQFVRIVIVVVLAITGMYFLSGLYYNLTPWGIEGDNGIFAEMARIQARGGLIFRDMWDIKPPGVFFYLVPFINLFGNTLTAVNVSVAFLNAVFPLIVGLLAYAVTQSWRVASRPSTQSQTSSSKQLCSCRRSASPHTSSSSSGAGDSWQTLQPDYYLLQGCSPSNH
jgi:hypothetical protein